MNRDCKYDENNLCIHCGHENKTGGSLRRKCRNQTSLIQPLLDSAKYLIQQAKTLSSGKNQLCTQDQIEARLAICQSCELYESVGEYCTICRCKVNDKKTRFKNKLATASYSCPDKPPRWKRIQNST